VGRWSVPNFHVLFQIVSASQAGDIQFLDIRNHRDAYLTIDAHRGSLTALAVHRHAPVIASGSAKQLIKVFSLEGEQLGTIRYYPSFMAQKIGSVSCLTFHPYQILLAAGAADAYVSIYADENGQARWIHNISWYLFDIVFWSEAYRLTRDFHWCQWCGFSDAFGSSHAAQSAALIHLCC
jgi:WD40 repeat protein